MTEDELITLTIDKSQRKRYRELLQKPKNRRKLLDKLNHSPPLEERYTQWFNTFQKALDSIAIDGGAQVRLLSSADAIDGKVVTFSDAIEETINNGWGTIIGINPALAIYYGEEGERGAVIQKIK
jgi:hypothetical protein